MGLVKRKPSGTELLELRGIARLQFGVGDEFIPEDIEVAVSPNTFKIRMVLLNDSRYLTIRAGDYRFNLHVASGRVLNTMLPHPRLRVYVKEDYVGFVAKGGNLFCKHVLMADPDIAPNDEVLVVSPRGELIAVGRAIVPGREMVYYKRGEAVRVREGVEEES
ncbi:PUA domain-containing protein [Desulfurococcus mucosus]|uniref:PUA domain containing protein n=1 Tax=Desulfurococcus mucosus (strain ATCC 35584 / DSM 2162 / JCM 9187 / O7/1) TaxID=765177 RepID=E8R781_DESM0|nr:PUA domain-containing protein [Desulfurococcus mucosus]ADV65546.1 PUA domain containing protein [Desulfurococcus mucosus DSM 2162]